MSILVGGRNAEAPAKIKNWQIAILVLLASMLVIRLASDPAPDRAYYRQVDRPLVIAHQGGGDLRPGDTMYAFEHAVALGADVLEMDAHITRDGQIVLMHDEKVDRTTDGEGLIEDLTLDQLLKLDAAYSFSPDNGATFPFRGQGIQVPTLEQLFQRFPDMRYGEFYNAVTVPEQMFWPSRDFDPRSADRNQPDTSSSNFPAAIRSGVSKPSVNLL